MLHVDERCCGLKKVGVSDRKQALLRMPRAELRGADQLYRLATIDALPDNVLLETFEFYLGKDDPDEAVFDGGHDYNEWQTLVHVCRRWRCVVFTSPRRLDLKLYCCAQERSADSKTLDIWPELPIVIDAFATESNAYETIIAALGHRNRVCKIDCYEEFQDSLLEEFAAIDEPFPALTSLDLVSSGQKCQSFPIRFWVDLPHVCDHSACLAFLIHQLEIYFHLPLTLSGFSFGVFLIPDIFHPRRSSLVCPCCPGSDHLLLDSDTPDLRPVEQADIRPRSLV